MNKEYQIDYFTINTRYQNAIPFRKAFAEADIAFDHNLQTLNLRYYGKIEISEIQIKKLKEDNTRKQFQE